MNTGGGVADGDRLHTTLAAGPGATLVAATQAAERIYRARPGAAASRIETHIAVAAGARIDYLPQETILFDDSALTRTLEIDLAPDAIYLGVESLVFGRAASGETLRTLRLSDTVRLRRDGRLIMQDSIRLHGDPGKLLSGPATAGGAGAAATLLYAAPDAAGRLDAVRETLAARQAGATCRDNLLIVRLTARTSQAARAAVRDALGVLRGGTPLPRVWDC